MNFDYTTETIVPEISDTIGIGSTGGFKLSVGNTAQRPVSPLNGTIRYNTDLNTVEAYTDNAWDSLVGTSSVDGTTNQITATPTTGAVILGLPNSIIAPGSLQYTTNFGYPIEIVAAAGATQGTATPITVTTTLITSGPVNGGVRLPVASFIGEIHAVTNSTVGLIFVYPNVGASIDNGAVNTPAFINAELAVTFTWDGTRWVTIQNSVSAGNTGITVSHTQGNVTISNAGVLSFSGGATGLTPVSPTTGAITLNGVLGTSNGGTGATNTVTGFDNLAPTNTQGDLIYHTGSINTRLPIGANTQVLGVTSGLPDWINQSSINAGTAVTSTTATNLAGGALGSIPYQTAPGNTTFVSAGTSSQVLVSGVTPAFVSVPTALGYTPVNKAGDTMAGTLNMNSNFITNLPDPVNDQDAATKFYVDSIAAGLSAQPSCVTATTAALPSSTYDNGSPAGFGATLTATANGAIGAVGGYGGLIVNDRVLVKDQADPIENGIYVVTQLGDGSNPWILTRAEDFDGQPAGATKTGDFTYIVEGTLMGTQWVLTTVADPIVMGTDPIIFSQLSGAANFTAGTGIDISSNVISNTGVLSLTTNTGLSTNVSATGNVSVTNTGVLSLIAGTGITLSGSTGNVTVSAVAALTTVTVTSNYTFTTSVLTAFANAASGGFTVTLPLSPADGEIHNTKKTDETRNVVTLDGNGANIDKYTTVSINVPFTNISVQWNSVSSRWLII